VIGEERRRKAQEKRKRALEDDARVARLFRSLGRKVDGVVDVGVRRGTPWLYEVFPDARFVLVDPQEGGEALLTARPADFVFVNKALGRAPGRRTINEQGAMSTFLERTTLTSVRTRKRYEAEIVTLDAVIAQHLPAARSIGLKIDTEGFELEVLAGLGAAASRVDFIVSEASVLNRFENSYNFSELIAELWKMDFRFYNILNPPYPKAPRCYDCLFFRKDDPAFDG
jgi:FkbM family methyltransferase